MSTPWWEWFTPIPEWDAITGLIGKAGNAVGNWLGSAAADIGSGIEAGMVALLGDLWNVIEGPLEILLGAVILIIVLAWAFKSQLISAAAMAAM